MLAAPPPDTPLAIRQGLAQCGLKAGGFTVRYDKLLQGIAIVISPQAGAKAEQFGCITAASDDEFVSFTDPAMQQAYQAWDDERARPLLLARLRADLDKRGLLKDMPERSDFASNALFAQAVEKHCGLKTGSLLHASADGLDVLPSDRNPSQADFDKVSCALGVVMYDIAKNSTMKVGFIGNEAYPPKK